MISLRSVSYSEILGEAELLAEYGTECSLAAIGPISPQAEMYEQMEKSGVFKAFGLFRGEKMIGFASVLIYVVPHYGQKIASVESIFLGKKNRSEGNGNRLMNAVENFAREQKCKVIGYSALAGSTFERLLSLMKPYTRTNSIYMRGLV